MKYVEGRVRCRFGIRELEPTGDPETGRDAAGVPDPEVS